MRSSDPTTYQHGFVFQAAPGYGRAKTSCAGAIAVAYTNLLVRIREVATEVFGPLLSEPYPSIRDVDTVEYGSTIEFVLLSLRGLALIGSEGAQVDQCSHAVIHAGVGNQSAAIGVADQNDWAPNPSDAPNHVLNVALEAVETMSTGDAVISLCLERANYPAETGSVRPEAMGKDDAGLPLFEVTPILLPD